MMKTVEQDHGDVMTPGMYGLPDFVRDLRAITAQTQDSDAITARVAPLARALALSPGWLGAQHYVPNEEQGFGIWVLHEEPDHSLLVFAAAWAPGRGVAPHNHGTWVVVAGVDGAERNVCWERVDDGSRPGYAKIRKVREELFGPGEVFTLRPDDIHSVTNDTARVTVSLHVYGFNLNLTTRSQFDPERDIEAPVTLTMNSASS